MNKLCIEHQAYAGYFHKCTEDTDDRIFHTLIIAKEIKSLSICHDTYANQDPVMTMMSIRNAGHDKYKHKQLKYKYGSPEDFASSAIHYYENPSNGMFTYMSAANKCFYYLVVVDLSMKLEDTGLGLLCIMELWMAMLQTMGMEKLVSIKWKLQ